MSIEKTLIHAQRIVDVLPQCRRDDMQNLIKLLDEQQKQITAQAETILQQRISLKQAHSNNAELFKALWVIGYMPETIISQETSRNHD